MHKNNKNVWLSHKIVVNLQPTLGARTSSSAIVRAGRPRSQVQVVQGEFRLMLRAHACKRFVIYRAEPQRTLSLHGAYFVIVKNQHGTFYDERRDAEII